MSMDYAANTGYCISYDELKKLCPQQVSDVENHPDFESWVEVAMTSYDDEGQLGGAVKKLCEEFSRETNVSGTYLELSFMNYSMECYSEYDDVDSHDGCIFLVDGVMMKTPAGERFEDQGIISKASFVTFG